MCPAVFVSSPSQFSAVSALVENSGKDTDIVVFTPEFKSLLLINALTQIFQIFKTHLKLTEQEYFIDQEYLICNFLIHPIFNHAHHNSKDDIYLASLDTLKSETFTFTS